MSNPEAAPLNHADVEAAEPPQRDPQSNPSNDELHDLLEMDTWRRRKAPLHILILYGLPLSPQLEDWARGYRDTRSLLLHLWMTTKRGRIENHTRRSSWG
ncbi:uncharacterized protein K444DRAFT_291076 [Hyaloscypha bicolor E]|uniref:Uncharacterized protein n=1 Tax=Hyaloscypha bicolor E TaxID=1095630 RepID=A0A2J6SFP9_9HELO|nr:uncharacterized protein K444DRAFT_291076 [Hyaloscypha bicolor E]PMD49587.1 hypothetical protein K444DRAFT_291076 [Hyaloscypha bicolor E]